MDDTAAATTPGHCRPPTQLSRLTSLSPSRASDFKTCPRLYRYRVVDRLAEAPSHAAVRGSLVHAVLESLFDLPPAERTIEQAIALLPAAWARLQEGDEQALKLGELQPDETSWLASAHPLLASYFALEDPGRYQPSGRELSLEVEVGEHLTLRGILDRLDAAPDGRLRVVDYKTGRAPAQGYEGRALFQLKFYALMVWRLHGVIPAVLRLMYLGDRTIIEHSPGEAQLLATERLLRALYQAIRTAHEVGDWPASPGPQCSWCSFTAMCPAGPKTADRDRLAP